MTAPIVLDLDAIEAAAKAAGGIEWMLLDGESGIEADSRFITSEARIDDNKVPFVEIHYGHPAAGMGEPFQSEQVAAGEFVAAASPAVVLELVRRLRAAEQNATRYNALRNAPNIGRLHVLDAAGHEFDELWEEVRGEVLDLLVDAVLLTP